MLAAEVALDGGVERVFPLEDVGAEEVARGTRQAQAKAEDAKNKYRKRQWEAAAALYSEAIALDPNDLLHLTNRAAVHFEVLCRAARPALLLLLLLLLR